MRPVLALLALVVIAAACGDDANDGAGDAASDPIEGPVWLLVELVGTDLAGAEATLQLLDGTASGQAGCNRFTGGYELDGHTVALGPLATTRMACQPPLDAIEAAYLSALEQADSFSVDGNRLVMRSEDGTPVLFYEVPISAA